MQTIHHSLLEQFLWFHSNKAEACQCRRRLFFKRRQLLLLFNQETQGSVLRRGWDARQKWGGLVLGVADALGLEAGRVAQRCPQATRARERGRFTSHGRVAPETAEAPETQIELRPSSPTGGCGAPTPGWLRRPGHRESCVHLHHRQAAATLPQGWLGRPSLMGGVGVGIVGWFAFLGVCSVRGFGVGGSVFCWPLLRLGVGGGALLLLLLLVVVVLVLLVFLSRVAGS